MRRLAKLLIVFSISTTLSAGAALGNAQATSLQITSITVIDIEDTAAVLSFNTTELSYYIVKFGTDQHNLNKITNYSNNARHNHEARLTNLTAKQTYYYTITAYTPGGEQVTTFVQHFTTEKKQDTEKPEILSARTTYTTNNQAFFGISANEKVRVRAVWWKDFEPNKKAETSKTSNANGDTEIVISRLQPNTRYEYQMHVTDDGGNTATTNVRSFRTREADFVRPALAIENIQPNSPNSPNITNASVTVSFRTTIPTLCTTIFTRAGSRNSGGYLNFPGTQQRESLYTLQATELEPGTDYEFYIHCHDVFGKRSTTQWYPVTTQGSNVLGFSSITGKPFNGESFELVRAQNDVKVYALVMNKKYHIKNPTILQSYGLEETPIRTISAAELNTYQNILLVRRAEDTVPQFLYLNKNMKKPLRTAAVNQSYLYNRSNEALVISNTDFASYEELFLVKTFDSPTVYKIEGDLKRPIASWDVFIRNNWYAWQIGEINQADLDSYITGATLF